MQQSECFAGRPCWNTARPARFATGCLEDRERAYLGAGAASRWCWRGHEQELPAFEHCGRLGERLDVEVVEHVHPERDHDDGVNRHVEARNGKRLMGGLAAEQGDVA